MNKTNGIRQSKPTGITRWLSSLVAAFLLMTFALPASAQREVDGITYYILSDATCSVYPSQGSKYSGKVVIPEKVTIDNKEYTVTKIDYQAFRNCTGLTEVIMPGTVIEIGQCAFDGCTALQSIQLSDAITKIGPNAFDSCQSLTSLKLPEALELIESYAFDSCTGLTSLVIPDNCTTIDYCAFSDCSSLKVITFGAKLSTIKSSNHIFSECTSLEDIWIYNPEPIKFEDNTGLSITTKVTIHVPEESLAAYRAAPGWSSILSASNITLTGFENNSAMTKIKSGDLYYYLNPQTLTGRVAPESEVAEENYQGITNPEIQARINWQGKEYSVSTIGEKAFAGSKITSITIPEGITSISKEAFSGCTSLASVKLPTSITSIASLAFSGCDAVTGIECSATTVPALAADAFTETVYENANVSVPALSIDKYKAAAAWKDFKNYEYTAAFIEHEGLRYMLDIKFHTASVVAKNDSGPAYTDLGSYNSKAVIQPLLTHENNQFKVTSIAEKAFQNSRINYLSIPSSIETIGAGAFEKAEVSTLDVPSIQYWNSLSITEPTQNPFNGGGGTLEVGGKIFTDLELPENVTDLRPYLFQNVTSLRNMKFPATVKAIGDKTFENCTSITDLSLPSTIEKIADNSFAGCSNIKNLSLDLEVSATLLSSMTAVTDLTIGTGVKTVKAGQFSGMTKLTNVTLKGDTPPAVPTSGWNTNAFSQDTYNKATLHVTAVAEPACYASSEWSQFKKTDAPDLTLGEFPGLIFKSIRDNGFSYQVSGEASSLYGDVVIPAKVNVGNYSVTVSEINDFRNCSLMKSLSIPDGYADISSAASFSGCSSLEKVIIPNLETWLRQSFSANSNPLSANDNVALCLKSTGETIKNLVVPSSITEINSYAFYNYRQLESVVIPGSVVAIGTSAFANCTGLKNATFENSSTSLNTASGSFSGTRIENLTLDRSVSARAFSGVASIGKLTFGANITAIPDYCFDGCTGIESVDIPANIVSIGQYAFNKNEKLSAVKIEKSDATLTIGNAFLAGCPVTELHVGRPVARPSRSTYPFSGMTGETVLFLSASTTTGEFSEFASLKKVNFLDGIEEIAEQSFYGCQVLEEVTVPASVRSIGYSAFQNCTNLSYLAFEDSRDEINIGQYAFLNCWIENLYLGRKFKDNSNIPTWQYLKSLETGQYVDRIENFTFSDCPMLYSVTIGVGVRVIAPNAFARTPLVKVIWMPNTPPEGYEKAAGMVNYVSQSSYDLPNMKNYSNLSSKFIVDNVVYVFNRTASDRTCVAIDCRYVPATSTLSVPNTVTYKNIDFTIEEINEYAFYNNTYVENTVIGNHIVAIGDYAYHGNVNLASVLIPNSVKRLGKWGFANCPDLESVILGTGLSQINDACFSGDAKLSGLMVPPNVMSIGNSVFDGCTGLKKFEISDRNTELSLGYSLGQTGGTDSGSANSPLFTGCWLEEVYIGGNITYSSEPANGYSPFYRNDWLKKVTIHNNETEVSENEFYGCRRLEEVIIGNGVEKIAARAFSGCLELQSFSFGTALKTIGEDAFSDCKKMKNLTSNTTVPPVCGEQALADINKFYCILHVPSAALDSYKNADQWRDFFNIVPITAVEIPVQRIEMTPSTLTLVQGELDQLEVEIVPEDASLQTLKWETSDPDVAMVSQFGYVVAISPGTCYITATTTDGTDIETTCFVTVNATSGVNEIELSQIRIVREGSSLKVVGASPTDIVTVLNLSGHIVHQSSEKYIDGLDKGIYVVIVNGKTFKIAV